MRSALWIRVAGVVLALVAASLVSFPSFPDTGMVGRAPSVIRTLKGDRLPVVSRVVGPHDLGLPSSPVRPESRKKIPVGCDAAFSPLSAPGVADFFGRCAV